MPRPRIQAAFTLVELMIVVAIVGILSSVAVPAFMRNARKAKTSEARVMVERLYNNARSYFSEEYNARGSGSVLARQFPATEVLTPAISCCSSPGYRCAPSVAIWSTPSWIALKFAMTDPHYFRYAFVSSGTETSSQFSAQAYGDLNCDGTLSTFEMIGSVQSDGTVAGQGGFFINKEVE